MMRGYSYSYGPAMMGGYSPWAGLLMLLFWLAILVGAVLLVVWAVRQSQHGGTTMPPHPGATPPMQQHHDEAMAIARKRLASGEITREQFEEIRQTLGG